MNASKVTVVGDATTGSVITPSENNPIYGYVKLTQRTSIVDDNGFLRVKPISTLLHAPVAELQLMNFYAGQELPGKIVIQESLEPFNQKNPRKDLKIAGSTGIVCTLNGQPIYRRTIYKQDSFAENKLIQHDNVEQLRNAYAAESGKSSAIKPNTAEDFSIGA
jgi:hypothetical protein